MLDFEDVLARWPLLIELDVWPLNIRLRQFSHLQAFHFFATRLYLARSRSGCKPRDEFVQLRDLLFPLRVLRFNLRTYLSLGHDHIVVGAGVGDDGLVVDVGNVSANAVEEVPVVGDGDHYSAVDIQKSLQ